MCQSVAYDWCMTTNRPQELIGSAEAAAILGVTVKTVTRYAARGTLTAAFKIAGIRGAYIFNRADVEAVKK